MNISSSESQQFPSGVQPITALEVPPLLPLKKSLAITSDDFPEDTFTALKDLPLPPTPPKHKPITTRIDKIIEKFNHEFYNQINQKTSLPPFTLQYCQVISNFHDICCPGESAVKIDDQFLHGNHIIIPNSNNHYIATQAPWQTAELFWKTCMYHSHVIVDLTRPGETVSAGPYSVSSANSYPEAQGEITDFSNFHVLCESCTKNQNIITYRYRVVDNRTNMSKQITRLNLINWEDHKDTSYLDLAALIETTKKEWGTSPKERKDALIVHCRAGVGRTGTFITAFQMQEMVINNQLFLENFHDVSEMLILMGRESRGPKYVQNYKQYQTIWKVFNFYVSGENLKR